MVIVKIVAFGLLILIGLVVVAFIYSRWRGPIPVPAVIVERLMNWEPIQSARFEGSGRLLVFAEADDLIPTGAAVEKRPPFESRILGGKRALMVYLPPGYDDQRAEAYPVIFALHGFGNRSVFWVDFLLSAIDTAIAQGEMPAAVMVMPDFSLSGNGKTPPGLPTDGRAGSWYVNSRLGRFQDHFFEEIVPFVRRSWHVTTDPERTALMGSSMGGFATLYYGLRFPGFARNFLALYPCADLRYSIGGYRLAAYDPAAYRPIDTDKPSRVMYTGVLGGLISPTEDFFLYPVFGGETVAGTAWGNKTAVWERLRAVNPVDLLRDQNPDLTGSRYFIVVGDRDEFRFDSHVPVLKPLLVAAGAEVSPSNPIVPGMRHDKEYVPESVKQAMVRWLARQLK